MVAKSHKPERKTAFGLKCRSPKGKEKKAAKRENRGLMYQVGQQASPKDGVVGTGANIAAEHENSKSPGIYTRALQPLTSNFQLPNWWRRRDLNPGPKKG
jgi:hypothetical protein